MDEEKPVAASPFHMRKMLDKAAYELSKRYFEWMYTECSYEKPCAYCRGEKQY